MIYKIKKRINGSLSAIAAGDPESRVLGTGETGAAKADKHGFTLMEVLVSMSIFIIVALASLTIYAAILKASQKTMAYTRIQQEAQLIMEVLAKKIRTSRVDYQYYADKLQPPFNKLKNPDGTYNQVINVYSNGEKELALTDSAGMDYLFATSTDSSSLDSLVISSKTANETEYGAAVPIPSQLVKIKDIIFVIQPYSYPFDINTPPVTQPRVTMAITFSSTKGAQTASFTVEQTVPQRSGGIVIE